MREILFRGKCGNKWHYGDLYTQSNTPQIIAYNKKYDKMDTAFVDPETVGQYTGLTDKNGVKIFEGDIVTIPDTKKMGLPAPIRYDYVRATFEVSRSGYNPLSLIDAREFYEVIGNIHDNPEILEEGGGQE